MHIVIIGGKLQGVEAAYLARKAGWEVTLVDRKTPVPASGLAQRFVSLDVRDSTSLDRVTAGADLILPALENDSALAALEQWSRRSETPMAFDFQAYGLTSSKSASNRLFSDLNIPQPKAWPHCRFPLIIKPSRASGSAGVRLIEDPRAWKPFETLAQDPSNWVIQEYLRGPSYSIEVVGDGEVYQPFAVTQLFMDGAYDCKRVTAPTEITPELARRLEEMAVNLAAALNLKGIMDVEVVETEDGPAVLEIDARFPSQTPTSVWWASGVNLLAALAAVFVPGVSYREGRFQGTKAVIYEHIQVDGTKLTTAGEHIMAAGAPLRLVQNFFGAKEALTNFNSESSSWVATLIHVGADLAIARERRDSVLQEIQHHCRLERQIDPTPPGLDNW